MNNPIPEERYILKQELWRKIDNAWEQTNNLAKEIYTKMEIGKKELELYYDKILTAQREAKEELNVLSQNELVQTKKELESFVQNEINRLILNQNEFLKKIDARITLAQDQMNERITVEVDFRMNRMVHTAEETERKVEIFENGIRKSIINFQNEMTGKFNEMKLKFDRVISNMKSLSNLLSK